MNEPDPLVKAAQFVSEQADKIEALRQELERAKWRERDLTAAMRRCAKKLRELGNEEPRAVADYLEAAAGAAA